MFRSRSNYDDAIYDLSILSLSILIAAIILSVTGVHWGQWYSGNYQLHDQARALLGGSLSISKDPAAIAWDYAWADGVQQPWGLGVPVWQALFELIYRVFGRSYFPESLALGGAALVASVAVLRTFMPRQFFKKPLYELRRQPHSIAPIFLLLLFPPFLSLCSTRMAVYEEVVVYSYLAALTLLAATVALLRKPTLGRYLLLSVLAGFTIFVRPTLFTYGFASQLLSFFFTRRLGWSLQKSCSGMACFSLIVALLLVTNFFRFGAPLEFGHKLTLNAETRICYSSRFYDPYSDEPIVSAVKELFSLLFLINNNLNGDNWYECSVLPGQADTVRWREFYFKTFDLSYLIFIIAAWISVSWRWTLDRRAGQSGQMSEPEAGLLVLWSLLSIGPLLCFYVRFPFVASRYMVDFAPAFAASILGGVFLIGRFISSSRNWRWLTVLLYIALICWWGVELKTARVLFSKNFPPAQYFSQPIAHVWKPSRKLPKSYKLGDDLKSFGILFNGAGWDLNSGDACATCSFFISDPRRLELEVTPIDSNTVTESDYRDIAAKIGLEALELEHIQNVGNAHRLVFRGPKLSRYQSGVQSLFLRFPFESKNDWRVSKFRLLSIAWQ